MTSRFPTIAGHPALDLLNTVHWWLLPSRQTNDITTYGDVVAWSIEAGLLTHVEAGFLEDLAAARPEETATAWVGFVELREAAYAALVFRSLPATDAILATWRDTISRSSFIHLADRWEWVDQNLDLSTPHDRVTRSLLDLMRSEQVQLLHQCEDDACGWVYLDTSPRRNRRWCIASDCGDRNRAREYYRRHRASASTANAKDGD